MTRSDRKSIVSGVIVAAGVMLPSLARACPVCFAAGGPRAALAYYLSTVLLSAMPFVLIGAVIGAAYLLRNRGQAPVIETPARDG